MNLKRLIYSDVGRIVISMILGLGLATLFRKVCKDRKCMIFRAPDISNIKDKIFKYNDKCYQYTEKSQSCKTHNKKIVDFA